MKKRMLINVADEEESRVAIVEDGTLEEFTIETASKEQIKGNIYNGVIAKVEPSLQAAFVDYGGNRHGFLPIGEVQSRWFNGNGNSAEDRERRPRIQDVLQRNQRVIVQVVKEELGTKGASLSTYISLPGRYLVLMPESETSGGISRKIEDEEERKKLKEIVTQLEPPPNMGIIVRTAGLNRNKAELQRDMAYLQRLWASIEDKSQQSPAPALIYQEQDLVIRSIRDYFTPDIQEVLVDDREVYYRARDFFQAVMPRYHGRVKLYREKRPLFAKYQLEEQLETVYSHKVQLKQGGSIVIDQTEALVAIDVNSGRATREKTIEETAFKTNTEAAQEVARQLRLRDLGGLIVIDFIDMRNPKHNQEIEKTFRQAVKRDKARTQVGRISQFGLLELSRQRLKPTILEGNYQNCPHCEGSGLIRSTVALALSVLRQIRAEAAKDTLATVNAQLPMDVAFYLLNQKRREIAQLEEEYNLSLNLVGNPLARQNEHSMDFVRRPASEEKAPAVEKVPAKETREAPSRSAAGGTQRRRGRGTRAASAVESATPAPKPQDGVAAAPVQPVAVGPLASSPVAAPQGGTRGRIFWRFNSASRQLENHDNGEPVAAKASPRSGRQAAGRIARRARGWWRRRASNQTAQKDGAAHQEETSAVSEPVEAAQE